MITVGTFFDSDYAADNRWYDELHKLFEYYLKLGIQFKSLHNINVNECDVLLFMNVHTDTINNLEYIPIKKYVIISEIMQACPQNWNILNHNSFYRCFVWDKSYIDIDKEKYIYTPLACISDCMLDMPINFTNNNKNKLCCIFCPQHSVDFCNEIYSKRIFIAKWFECNHPNDLEFYGFGWGKTGIQSSIFKGCIPDVYKHMVYNRCYFNICFESNCGFDGWVTEKIFHSFFCGCVPIYYGAPNISELIPEDCYIDMRRFCNYNDLYDYLLHLRDSGEYNNYIEKINKYINSECINTFSYKFLFDKVIKTILEDNLNLKYE